MGTEARQAGGALVPARVLVVLPAYNEESNLGRLLEEIEATLRHEGWPFEVIVVDDGSTDATAAVAKGYAPRVSLHLERHDTNLGLGATLRDGLRIAGERSRERDVVVVMDADATHPPGLIPRMTRAVGEGADVVIASRYRPGARVRGLPLSRRLLSWGASWLFRLLLPTPGVRDYTCGYRAYRASLLRRAFERYGDAFVGQEGFACAVEVLVKLRDLDALFTEVPLILRYDRKHGASKMKVGNTIRETLLLLARRRLRLHP